MKKFFALLCMILLCCICVAAQAATTSDGLEYTAHDTYIEITGYTGSGIRLTIPDTIDGLPVTHIAAEAFSGTTSLYALTLPEGLLSIGDKAFGWCSNLTAVNLPSSLQKLGEYAFADCDLSGTITIPESITVVPTGAFKGNQWLTTVNLSAKTTSVGLGAFGNCTALKSISFPNGLKSIGENAFYGCESLTAISLPNTLQSIQSGAFMNCAKLSSMNWPAQLEHIGEQAFSGCKGLTAAAIPEGVTVIRQRAFEGCTSLKSVTLPSNLEKIDGYAFSLCTALKSMNLPESVSTIADSAFASCTVLSHTTVPGSYADNWCIRNSSMYSALFTYEQTSAGKVITGYTGTGSSVYIPPHVVGIGFEAFRDNKKITSLHVPGNVKTVGAWSFYQCDNLTHVRLENGVEKLDDEAFSSCDNLISINIPDSVTELGSHTFYATYSLESISLPDSITTIPDNCFSQANKLKSVKLPANLTSIGKYAFNATALEEIAIPETVTIIDDYAFITCLKLQEISIPENVTSIGAEAFRGCKELKKITILENVTSIGEDAFEGCPDELVIYGMTGSRAQSYADEYEITFVALDAEDTLPAPQNPSWKAGSTATATWDAVEGADYYELTVYVYDEAGTKLLGTTTTGTSINEVDVQLEANTIIKQQETEYAKVKLAYTVKAGVADDKGEFTYGAESETAEMWEYTFALIQLKAPEIVTLNENCLASWSCVENAESYSVDVTVYGLHPALCTASDYIKAESLTSVDGMITYNLSDLCEKAYKNSVSSGYLENGMTVEVFVTIYAMAADDGLFVDGEKTASSTISYLPAGLIKLQTPENVALNDACIASWSTVSSADYYWITVIADNSTHTSCNKSDMVSSRSLTTEDGKATYDLSNLCKTVYKMAIEHGCVENGETIDLYLTIDARSSNSSYLNSEIAVSNSIRYQYTEIIQLQTPENVELDKNCTANWSHIENAEYYFITITADGLHPALCTASDLIRSSSLTPVNGMITYDLSKLCQKAYKNSVERGYLENGKSAQLFLTIYATAAKNTPYSDSEKAMSGKISYVPFTPVESIILSPSAPVLYVGNSYTLGKTITPEDGHYTTIDWSSTNSGVVSVNSDGKITGMAAGDAQVTAAIGDVKATVPVKVYTISSNIGDKEDKDHVTDSAGDIIDDIVNKENPDLGNTDIPAEDLEDVKDQVTEGIWRGDEFFTDMKWYEEAFEKYKKNWGQIQKAASELNAQFAGAYNITVEMYHKDANGGTIHPIGCIEEFENEITFAFDLPTGNKEVQSGYARKYVLVRVHKNEIEAIDAVVSDGKVTAKSDGFSDFILLYVDEPIDGVDLIGLKTLTLPAFLTEIEDEAFVGVAAEVVIIPASCTSIGSRAFADCPNLKYIVLPVGADITPANDAFEGCNATILYR